LEDTDEAARIGSVARSLAETEFSLGGIVARFERLLEGAVDRAPASRVVSAKAG